MERPYNAHRSLASNIGHATKIAGNDIKNTGDPVLIACYRILLNICDVMLEQSDVEIEDILVETSKKIGLSHLTHNKEITKEQREVLENWVFYDKL